MNLVIITTPHCIECRSKKTQYKAKGIELNEIEASSPEGMKLVEEFHITKGGTIIDLDEGVVL